MGGGGEGADTVDGVLHGAKLALQKDGFALLQGLVEEGYGVAYVRPDGLPAAHEGIEEGLGVQGVLVVEVDPEDIFQFAVLLQPVHEPLLVKEVSDLDAQLGVLVRIEGGDARLGGAESLAAQPLLLIGVLEGVVGHEKLGALVHQDMWIGHTAVRELLQLGEELGHVQGYAGGDDVGGVGVEHARGELVKGKPAILTDDGVPRVGAALEADHHIGLFGQQVGDLAFALVTPVGAYDRFYHITCLRVPGFAIGTICLFRDPAHIIIRNGERIKSRRRKMAGFPRRGEGECEK